MPKNPAKIISFLAEMYIFPLVHFGGREITHLYKENQYSFIWPETEARSKRRSTHVPNQTQYGWTLE